MRAGLPTSIFALGLVFQQVAATGWTDYDSFSCPSNTKNDCDDKEQSGFDWSDLKTGSFDSYNSFSFSGFECQNSFGKRDALSKRTFNSKCIKGVVKDDDNSSPKLSCDKGKKFSIDQLDVSVDYDIDLEFHYQMDDGSTCKHVSPCKASGSSVKNTQCGGAKAVTVKMPSKDKGKGKSCGVGIHSIKFNCNTQTSSKPGPPKTTSTPSTVKTSSSTPYVTTSSSTSSSTPYANASTTSTTPSSSYVTPSSGTTPGPVASSSTTSTTPSSSYVTPSSGTTPGPVASSSTTSTTPSSSYVTPSSGTTPGPVASSSTTTSTTPSSSSGSTPSAVASSSTTYSSSTTTSTPYVTSGTTAGPVVSSPSGSSVYSVPVTTVITYVSITTCDVTNVATSGSAIVTTTSKTVSTTTVTYTTVLCDKCAMKTSEIPSSPTGSHSPKPAPVIPDSGCPELVPRCLNTWIFSTGCADNADASCYCKLDGFVNNVVACVQSWGSEAELENAVSFFAGICAAYIPQNPAIITAIPCPLTAGYTPPSLPAPTVSVTASAVAPPPKSVPLTTITASVPCPVTKTTTVSATLATTVPSGTMQDYCPTIVVVPQVALVQQPGPGSSVVLSPGTQTVAPVYTQPGPAAPNAPSPTGVAKPTSSGPAAFTGAAASTSPFPASALAVVIGGLLMLAF
ncbi:MAG: hypothetical protein M1813_004499 [Trichoglossum hirsutum]|nr:MAG: hypothetical protein M1813_004499 [Trichoglossum hirsutum]